MILADLEAPAVENCTFRMADFYNFIHLTHKTINPKVNVKDLFKKLEEEQNALFRDGDILAELLEEWLDREANLGRSMTTSELYLEIKGLWEQKGNKDFIYKSAIGFGKALVNTIQLFRGKYRVLCQKGAGRKKEYQFNRIDAVSRTCELFNGKVQGEK